MRVLSLVIITMFLISGMPQTNSPHGRNFKISCNVCHSSKNWLMDKTIYSFNHDKTRLPLVGQHKEVNCKQCHQTLVFSDAKTNCIDCHKDIHQATVGLECSRCHTPTSWLVNNINDIHKASRFPLLGAHRTADCTQCHKTESRLRFDVPGINCIDCHRDAFLATTNPNHVQSGFSEDCISCHPMTSLQWAGAGFNHSMFPLVQGHSTAKCADCHTSQNFKSTSPLCYSCHQTQYTGAKNPDHVASGFATTCQDCHTLSPGWIPAAFNHTSFPLTLGHATPTCNDCHKGNYKNLPSDCYSCHQTNYTSTANPNHLTLGFPTACATCHTTNPGWKPASFNHTTFALTLGHATPLCNDCHKGNYTNLPTDCFSCHSTDYNNSTNPNHKTLGFATTCATCHTTTPGWKPAQYTQHDTQFFPIYSGRHRGTWTNCSDCHTNTANYLLFNCIRCHTNVHPGKNYTNPQCYQCHPKGTSG